MLLQAPNSSTSESEEGSWDRHLLTLNCFFHTLFLWLLKESFSFALEGDFVKWPGSEIVHPSRQN